MDRRLEIAASLGLFYFGVRGQYECYSGYGDNEQPLCCAPSVATLPQSAQFTVKAADLEYALAKLCVLLGVARVHRVAQLKDLTSADFGFVAEGFASSTKDELGLSGHVSEVEFRHSTDGKCYCLDQFSEEEREESELDTIGADCDPFALCQVDTIKFVCAKVQYPHGPYELGTERVDFYNRGQHCLEGIFYKPDATSMRIFNTPMEFHITADMTRLQRCLEEVGLHVDLWVQQFRFMPEQEQTILVDNSIL